LGAIVVYYYGIGSSLQRISQWVIDGSIAQPIGWAPFKVLAILHLQLHGIKYAHLGWVGQRGLYGVLHLQKHTIDIVAPKNIEGSKVEHHRAIGASNWAGNIGVRYQTIRLPIETNAVLSLQLVAITNAQKGIHSSISVG
jgi:hypothetical protein